MNNNQGSSFFGLKKFKQAHYDNFLTRKTLSDDTIL